jgi:hypothetical protein
MEIKIGIQHSARELVVESSDSADDIEQAVSAAVTNESVLTLTDAKGRKVIVPAAKLAYVEIGGGVSGQVGFRS